MFGEIGKVVGLMGREREWKEKVGGKGGGRGGRVEEGKVREEDGVVVRGEKGVLVWKEENSMYEMIGGGMVEGLCEKWVKDVRSVRGECGGVEFRVKGRVVKERGWGGVYGEEKEEIRMGGWEEGERVRGKGWWIREGKRKGKGVDREGRVVWGMERGGKEIEEEGVGEGMKECGMGSGGRGGWMMERVLKGG